MTLPQHSFISTKISTMADWLNLSAGQKTAFLAALVSEGGCDLDTVTLSKTSTRRAAKKVRFDSATAIKESFIPPPYVTLHWDGKIVAGDGERLGVLIVGMPDHKEGKLLGISPISDGTGTTQDKL